MEVEELQQAKPGSLLLLLLLPIQEGLLVILVWTRRQAR